MEKREAFAVLAAIRQRHPRPSPHWSEALSLIEQHIWEPQDHYGLRASAFRALAAFGEDGLPIWRRFLQKHDRLLRETKGTQNAIALHRLRNGLAHLTWMREKAAPLLDDLVPLMTSNAYGLAYEAQRVILQIDAKRLCEIAEKKLFSFRQQPEGKRYSFTARWMGILRQMGGRCEEAWARLLKTEDRDIRVLAEQSAAGVMQHTDRLALLLMRIPPRQQDASTLSIRDQSVLHLLTRATAYLYSYHHSAPRYCNEKSAKLFTASMRYLQQREKSGILVSPQFLNGFVNVLYRTSACFVEKKDLYYPQLFLLLAKRELRFASSIFAFLLSHSTKQAPWLRKQTESSEKARRLLALQFLATLPPKEHPSLSDLLELLGTPNPPIQEAALHLLKHKKTDAKKLLPLLFSLLQKEGMMKEGAPQSSLGMTLLATFGEMGLRHPKAFAFCQPYWQATSYNPSSRFGHASASCWRALEQWDKNEARQKKDWIAKLYTQLKHPSDRARLLRWIQTSGMTEEEDGAWLLQLFEATETSRRHGFLQWLNNGGQGMESIYWKAIHEKEDASLRHAVLTALSSSSVRSKRLLLLLLAQHKHILAFRYPKLSLLQLDNSQLLLWIQALSRLGREDLLTQRFLLRLLWKPEPLQRSQIFEALRKLNDPSCKVTSEVIEWTQQAKHEKINGIRFLAQQKGCLAVLLPLFLRAQANSQNPENQAFLSNLQFLFYNHPKEVLAWGEKATPEQQQGLSQALLYHASSYVYLDVAKTILKKKTSPFSEWAKGIMKNYISYFTIKEIEDLFLVFPLFREVSFLSPLIHLLQRNAPILKQWMNEKKGGEAMKRRIWLALLNSGAPHNWMGSFLQIFAAEMFSVLRWALEHPKTEIVEKTLWLLHGNGAYVLRVLQGNHSAAVVELLWLLLKKRLLAGKIDKSTIRLIDMLSALTAWDGKRREEAIALLSPYCKRGERPMRWAVISFLAQHKAKQSVGCILSFLAEPSLETGQRSQLLGWIGLQGEQGAAAVPWLIQHLESPDHSLRNQCITSLGQIGLPAASSISKLLKILDAPYAPRWLLLRALGQMGEEAAVALPTVWKLFEEALARGFHGATDISQALSGMGHPVLPRILAMLRK